MNSLVFSVSRMKSILIVVTVGLLVSAVEAEEKIPIKITKILERMKTIPNDSSPEAVLDHLGLASDNTVKDLDGDGSLGSAYESYDVGVGDEWVLCIDFTEAESNTRGKHGKQTVFMVKLQRGSIKKLKMNQDQNWRIVYPYWYRGKMIVRPPDEEEKAIAHPPGVNK